MIELFYWPTPNCKKISILLEELNVPYKIVKIDINKNEQFKTDFTIISPTSKVPAIIDHDNNQKIFESGAILIYLAEKHKRFLEKNYYWEIMKWLTFQISTVGPFLGQAHQFLYYNPGMSKYAENKFINYSKRIYTTLNNQLKENEYLANNYSIADIATWPWIASHERHKINIMKYSNLFRWYKKISKRSAVIKGYNASGENKKIPLS